MKVVFNKLGKLKINQKPGSEKTNIIRVDGAMSKNDWLIQFLSDISKSQIEKSYNLEATSKGAAILASLGSGLISSLEESNKFWKLERKFYPKMNNNDIKKYRNGWNRAIKKTIM